MAFFPRNFYGDASFTPLFRLLDDFDNYSRQGQATGRRSGFQHWQPKFDVREVADAYELNGELPGLTKENVHIEFTEPQTMLVRGKVERSYTSGTPPVAQVEDSTMSGAITEGEEATNSHQATVEDENEAGTTEPAPEQASTEVAKNTEQEKPAAEKAKYWLSERSIGEFSRSFSFPARVDQEAVSASMKDGILTIHVPKAKKHESRRITVE
jgi:HSP20 family molecular chaperone IbpA